MTTERRTNDSPLRNGQLDEGLKWFRTEPVDENSGVVIFQFETGGFNVSFKRKMTMTEIADKFEELAVRVRRYQANGWPMYIAEGH
jgi:hypothetical protein